MKKLHLCSLIVFISLSGCIYLDEDSSRNKEAILKSIAEANAETLSKLPEGCSLTDVGVYTTARQYYLPIVVVQCESTSTTITRQDGKPPRYGVLVTKNLLNRKHNEH